MLDKGFNAAHKKNVGIRRRAAKFLMAKEKRTRGRHGPLLFFCHPDHDFFGDTAQALSATVCLAPTVTNMQTSQLQVGLRTVVRNPTTDVNLSPLGRVPRRGRWVGVMKYPALSGRSYKESLA